MPGYEAPKAIFAILQLQCSHTRITLYCRSAISRGAVSVVSGRPVPASCSVALLWFGATISTIPFAGYDCLFAT
ncbi:hypothetical protein AOV_03855 [Anaplasma ovis str. Haibei]|uniref:Uncharacterized protein n=1 Tax=Anaplasma ovis str. Haibei TaxID=1248439 RepID=A0A2Z2LIG7_9RICK|nr:hypothetical protein AOV_03830 [Anaplasma ovis str. Haibei]ASI47921.1 hypothetical protein AOV_03855 [Anaplasma ovis str. Haibei]